MPVTFHIAVLLCVMTLPLSAVSAMAKGKFGALGTFAHFERIGGFAKYVSSVSAFAAFILFAISNVVLPALLVASATYAVAGYLMLALTSGSGMPRHSSDDKTRHVEGPRSNRRNPNRARLMAWQIALTIVASITLIYALMPLPEIISVAAVRASTAHQNL